MSSQDENEIVTTDLAKFGYREIKMAAELLSAYVETPDVLGDGVTVAMNTHSGYVFLTDEDYRTAMMNGGKLEEFITCAECGNEGFQEEFKDNVENCKECKRIYKQGYFSDSLEDEEESS